MNTLEVQTDPPVVQTNLPSISENTLDNMLNESSDITEEEENDSNILRPKFINVYTDKNYKSYASVIDVSAKDFTSAPTIFRLSFKNAHRREETVTQLQRTWWQSIGLLQLCQILSLLVTNTGMQEKNKSPRIIFGNKRCCVRLPCLVCTSFLRCSTTLVFVACHRKRTIGALKSTCLNIKL